MPFVVSARTPLTSSVLSLSVAQQGARTHLLHLAVLGPDVVSNLLNSARPRCSLINAATGHQIPDRELGTHRRCPVGEFSVMLVKADPRTKAGPLGPLPAGGMRGFEWP